MLDRYNDPSYRFYVVDAAAGVIDSGWKFREDAVERASELHDEGGKPKVMTKPRVGSQVLDPNDDTCWEMRRNKARKNPGPDVHLARAREQLARAKETKEPIRKIQRIAAAMQEAYWVMSDEGPHREEAAKLHREALRMRDDLAEQGIVDPVRDNPERVMIDDDDMVVVENPRRDETYADVYAEIEALWRKHGDALRRYDDVVTEEGCRKGNWEPAEQMLDSMDGDDALNKALHEAEKKEMLSRWSDVFDMAPELFHGSQYDFYRDQGAPDYVAHLAALVDTLRQDPQYLADVYEVELPEDARKNPSPEPTDKALYAKVKAEAKKKFDVWPSAYASAWLTREYKKRGGGYRGRKPHSTGLPKWFKEDWVDLSRPKKGGGFAKCGRPSTDMSRADFEKSYPKCVPASRAAKMTPAQIKSAVSRKRAAEKAKPTGQKSPTYVRTNPQLSASRQDLEDAVDHASLLRDEDWTVDDFRVIPMGMMTVRGIENYADSDDFSSWLEVDPDDFKGLSLEERLEELQGFRSAERWADRIPRWLEEGVPPVVIIEAPIYEEGQVVKVVGDGRGRVNMATALGIKLPVVVMRWRGRRNPRDGEDALPAIYIYSRAETEALFQLGRADNVLAMVSIGDRGQPDPEFLETACDQGIEVLRLDFDDVGAGEDNAPDEEDVRAIVEFLQEMLPRLEEEGGILLIHCEAGISRSGASAALAWMMTLPDAGPEEIAALLVKDRQQVYPNEFMLEMGAPLVGKHTDFGELLLEEVKTA